MRREEVALAVVRGLVKHPRAGNLLFRLDKWGNILGPDRFTDPYPIWERMRSSGPVSFSPLLQQWAVVGYEEARQILSSPSFGVAGQMELLLSARPYSRLSDSSKALFRNALLFTDPPLHTRLRAAISGPSRRARWRASRRASSLWSSNSWRRSPTTRRRTSSPPSPSPCRSRSSVS
jgi:cytochrome P450